MTDDEPFIRAIVNAPADDAPRLVYADWLDERGDRRGSFLRQELQAFRGPRDGPAFRAGVRDLQLARRVLDPVWASRVSRPPVGVCSDVIRWDTDSTSRPASVELADIRAYEARAALVLPPDYKAFLLNQGGGTPYPGQFQFPNTDREEPPVQLEGFAGIDPRNRPYDHPVDGSRRLLAINGDGANGSLFLEVAGPYVGSVTYHWNFADAGHDVEGYVRVTESFALFLASLITTDPEWAQHIVRNDLPRLRAWLDAGGDSNAGHPENELTPLGYAITWERVDAIRELLAHGARPTRDIRQLSSYRLNPEIARLLDGAARTR